MEVNLELYENFIRFVANDRIEFSYDKIREQRDDYVKRARKLLNLLEDRK